MKKIVFAGLFILASLSLAATAPTSTTDIEKTAAAIDNQINVIEQQANKRYLAEQAKAEQASQNVADYSQLLDQVQEQLDTVAGERKVSFYEKEYSGVESALSSLKKDLTNSVNANQKIVDAFEEFSAIVGQ